MPIRLFRRRRPKPWPSGPSPVAADRRDKPNLAGRRAFLAEHVFLHTHIPKTAGSTLSHGLASIVGAVNTVDLRLNRRVGLDEMSAEDLARLNLVSGHFAYGVHTRFERRPLYVAAVREPVERAVSGYRFLQTPPDHPDHPHVKDRDFETAWEALREALGRAAENTQARMLTDAGTRRDVPEDALWAQIDHAYFLIIPQPEMTRAIQRLRAAFGVPWTRVTPHNISRGYEVELSTDMRTRILAANRVDTELFARISEDFDDRLQRACDYIASHCLLPLEDGDS